MKNYKKIIAGAAAIVISAGATTSIAFAKGSADTINAPSETSVSSAETGSTAREAIDAKAFKDETVYVLCNSNSDVKQVIVSDWIRNAPALSAIPDVSSLTDIQNVKGYEPFSQNGSELTWEAGGNDIYYRGNSDKELPVTVKMKYILDGKEVSPDDIVGKSGHLVIRWEYTNNVKMTVNVDGTDREYYVPFIAASAALFDSSKFLNPAISSGKVISDGNRLIVVGIGLPGVSESLGLDQVEGLDLTLPEYVEFSADVTDFQKCTSVTAVSNEIFSSFDGRADFSFGNIKDQIDELIAGADQLAAGTVTLSEGLDTLASKNAELTAGSKKLSDGAKEIKDGADKLSAGAEALSDGAKTLSDSTGTLETGLKSAKDGADQLSAGADKLTEGSAALKSGLDSSKKGTGDLKSGAASLTSGADALNKGAKELSAGLGTASDSLSATIAANEQALAALRALYQQSPSTEIATTIETLKQTIAAQKQIAASMSTGGTLNSGAAALQQGAAQLSSGSQTLSAGINNLDSGLGQLSTGAADLNKGLGDIRTGAASLDSGLGQLLTGSTQLSEGALKLYQSTGELSKGAGSLSDGADTLWNGAVSLNEGITAYVDAVVQLKDGAAQVRDGMAKFNEEGVSKIAAALDEKLPAIVENVKALQEVSRRYNSYSGISEDMDGAVKFIYMFDGTSAPQA